MDGVARGEAGVQGHRHGAEVLAQAARHRGGDAQGRPQGLRPELQQPAARGGNAEDSQGARHVPARFVQAGIELASSTTLTSKPAT